MQQGIARLAGLIARSRRIVAFTGAGISTESGIPDFRSPGGIWDRYPAVTYQEFLASEEARRRYWVRSRETYPVVAVAQPNPAHRALVALERSGRLLAVITQNVDRLHQRAGHCPERVIEVHGHAQTVLCLQCAARYPRDEVQRWLVAGTEIPACLDCGGLLKSATVSFGEPMPREAMDQARAAARAADLVLVVGSSLAVFPAGYIPIYGQEAGAALAIVNRTPTPLDVRADLVVQGWAGEILPPAVELALDGMG